jgi:hypothetical protein
MDWTKKSHFMKLPEKLLIVEQDVEQAGTLWDHFRQEGYATASGVFGRRRKAPN